MGVVPGPIEMSTQHPPNVHRDVRTPSQWAIELRLLVKSDSTRQFSNSGVSPLGDSHHRHPSTDISERCSRKNRE